MNLKSGMAKSILTTMLLGVLTTAWAVYNDVQAMKKDNERQDEKLKWNDEAVKEIREEVGEIHWYLIGSKKKRQAQHPHR